ncbi:MAG: PIN/TRAM domain-containing protein [Pirellulaceae bacterium]
MALWLLRCVFILASAGMAFTVINSDVFQSSEISNPWLVYVVMMAGAVVIIVVDVITPRKRIEIVTCVYFGIVIGLFLTWVISFSLEPLFFEVRAPGQGLKEAFSLVLGVAFCYICISLLLQTRDDFRFIIPFVEFSKEVKGVKPYLLDTSVVIDGRIADLVETNVFDNQLVMPRFVLAELQTIADSSDKLRRSRGRRGLDILNRLRTNPLVDLRIHDRETPEMSQQPVDMKLVLLAKHMGGKVVTGDYNLNKMSKIHGVPVINLNDISNALKPVYLPGEQLEVRIVKIGEEPGQGVGYLDDGTMIVVEGGRDHVSDNVRINVTSVLQTSAGRMIFGRYKSAV